MSEVQVNAAGSSASPENLANLEKFGLVSLAGDGDVTPADPAAVAAAAAAAGAGVTLAGDEPKPELSRGEKLAAQIATLDKRIAADTIKVAEVRQTLATLSALESIVAGTPVEIKIGRDKTLRNVTGTVTAVKTLEDGSRRLQVFYKEPEGTELAKDELTTTGLIVIQESQIVQVIAASA